ncbi:MAG: hypothetical protein Fur0010_01950 [Bdellovibrio sp.]
MRQDFTYTAHHNPHALRGREIIKKYPQVKSLMHPYPMSALYISLIVLSQFALGIYFSTANSSWWIITLAGFFIGAFMNHALFVMIHEACHDVIVKSRNGNKIWGIICNLPQAFPSAIGFRTYHLLHHAHLNEYDYDADLAFHAEAKWVGNSRLKKVLWFVGFMFIEAIRPMRLKKGNMFDNWVLINFVIVLTSDFLLFHFFGMKALGYLLISTFFSVGLHPVGARWIQEHYTFKEGQETYSYYGLLNKLAFNIGYHNEHHDLFKIPWVHLPKLKAMAPEFYDHLYSHRSWTKLLIDFIWRKDMDLYARIVRNRHEDDSRDITEIKEMLERQDLIQGNA